MQRSRVVKGLQNKICQYEPKDLFDGNFEKALHDLFEFKDEPMLQYASFKGADSIPVDFLDQIRVKLLEILQEIAKI